MIHNVHTRTIPASAQRLAEPMDTLGGALDRWWPAPGWVPLVLDRPLGVGAAGGHGPIRYRVTAYEPGRRVLFTFDPACGLTGQHELSVTPSGASAIIRHELHAVASGATRLAQPVIIALHDGLIEDLFDNAERAATGTVRRPARWSPLVRVLQRAAAPRASSAPVPDAAGLAQRILARWGGRQRVDLLDAYKIPHHWRLPDDPQQWADAVFRRPPGWVVALLGLRQLLVGFVGIERGDAESFATRERTDNEVLLGTDAGHLNFRVSVQVAGGAVTVTTIAAVNNRRGRLYLLPVRLAHPVIVRAMLTHAHRRFAAATRLEAGGERMPGRRAVP